MATANNNLTNLTNLDLSIQINLNGLSFCVLNTESQTVTFIKQVAFEEKTTPIQVLDKLKQCFITIPELNIPFNNVRLVYVNELFTLVPETLFDESLLADYLKYNTKILKSDFIDFDTIYANHSKNVYVPYVNINNYIYDKFGSFSYKHYATILIEQILQQEAQSAETKVYIHVGQSHFEIIVVKNGKLLLYNTFEHQTKEDFIYYILFTAEQLKLNPDDLSVVLLGNIIINDDYYNILYKYVRHVAFGHRKDSYNYNYTSKPTTNYSDFILIHSFS